jgi:hypothetical protein
MPATVSEKLNRLLDLVVDNVKKEKEVAEYPDMASLEAYVVRKVVCKKNYQCALCKVQRRNKCWRQAQAHEKRLELRKMIVHKELDREKLIGMKMSELFVVASLLGLRYRFGAKITKNSLIANILKKLGDKGGY